MKHLDIKNISDYDCLNQSSNVHFNSLVRTVINNINDDKAKEELTALYDAYLKQIKEFAHNARVSIRGDRLLRKDEFYRIDDIIEFCYFEISLDGELESYFDSHNEELKRFVIDHFDELKSIKDLYDKIMSYVNDNCPEVYNYYEIDSNDRPSHFRSAKKWFLSQNYSYDEMDCLVFFLDDLTKEEDIIKSFKPIAELDSSFKGDLLMAASMYLEGGMDLFKTYYSSCFEEDNYVVKPKKYLKK